MKGILFKPEMIKAIVEGRKTQTRRVIKPQPFHANIEVAVDHIDVIGQYVFNDGTIAKPHYQVGEDVYIKEACCQVCYEKDGIEDACLRYDNGEETKCADAKWRSPLFMPAWAARYFIKITDVRAERLQEITEEGAIKEGAPAGYILASPTIFNPVTKTPKDYRAGFERLWGSINKPPYDWQSNPWVWVYDFVLSVGE